MEILLLAAAGAAGLAALLTQSKPLPSDADFKKAQDTLKTTPEDPDANLVAGKYIAFVTGDYDNGMAYLAKSNDKTLRTLAEHERAPLYTDTAPQKVGMGDEWVAASKTFPALFRIFYDRAAHWYSAAWPDLDATWKDRTRTQGRKLAASRPPGGAKKAPPSGWVVDPGNAGRPIVIDGAVARTGSYSIRIPAADEKVKNSYSSLKSELIPIPASAQGKPFEVSAYVLADGTENGTDSLYGQFFDNAGSQIGTVSAYMPVDTPFWNRVSLKGTVPNNAVRAQFSSVLNSKKGSLWIDDASMKIDGKEILKNGSFEDR